MCLRLDTGSISFEVDLRAIRKTDETEYVLQSSTATVRSGRKKIDGEHPRDGGAPVSVMLRTKVEGVGCRRAEGNLTHACRGGRSSVKRRRRRAATEVAVGEKRRRASRLGLLRARFSAQTMTEPRGIDSRHPHGSRWSTEATASAVLKVSGTAVQRISRDRNGEEKFEKKKRGERGGGGKEEERGRGLGLGFPRASG